MKTRYLLAAAPLALGGCHLVSDNLHTVENAKVYRSAQLEGAELEERINELGLRSVLNLRGEKPSKEWYQDELAVCKRNGVTLYNVRMSARRLPHRDEIARILDVFEKGPYPMLIHCFAGADRSGLASALYQIHMNGSSTDDADDQLSICYGHIGIPLIGAYEMDRFLILYDQSHTRGLREFLETYNE